MERLQLNIKKYNELKKNESNIQKYLYNAKRKSIQRCIFSFIKWYRREHIVGPIMDVKQITIIYVLLFLFILNLIIGIIIIVLSTYNIECRIPYDYKGRVYTNYSIIMVTANHCKGIKDALQLTGKLYVYYELSGMSLNPHIFINSYKKEQLAGKIFTNKDELMECFPKHTKRINGVEKMLHPCGLYPYNIFKDNFVFYAKEPNVYPYPSPITIHQSVEDITIEYYRKFFKNPTQEEIKKYEKQVHFWMDSKTQNKYISDQNEEHMEETIALSESLNYKEAGEGLENSHFINWMIPSPINIIKHLYAHLEGPLVFPFYIYIENRMSVKHSKTVIITTASYYGYTPWLGIIFIIIAFIILCLTILKLIRMKKSLL